MLNIKAPAKINLHLAVKGRRPDGFHDLESIFLALDWGDSLCFDCGGAEGQCAIQTTWDIPIDGAVIQPEENVVFKAVSLFRARSGFMQGLRIRLDKRIPLGAGLGGGSSDAAATLLALNQLSDVELPLAALRELAEDLGSDVPFFLSSGAAFVSGRGERVEPLVAPEGLSVVLVYPGFVSNTRRAFALLDADGHERCVSRSREVLVQALGGKPADWPYHNDFLPVFLAAGTGVYRDLLGELRRLGADFASLSGSGSTCFGVFSDENVASRAVEAFRWCGGFICLTFPLAYSTRGY
ncbi:MAG: 4-(cytidine 5'-diphospho)-2-C-methyl-D-erythritol kinase [Treponema sp.]|nr:4-(cytidine 5'-diphospho)-2-C-methyl-D-erythritol kinase [Treponema sp.]